MPDKPKQRRVINLRPSVAYWKALGQFIEEFATVETAMFAFLAMYIGLTPRMGRAIFHGMRADGVVECFKRALAVKPPSPAILTELNDAISQFKAISTLRNDIVHAASFLTNDQGRIVSNIARKGTAGAPKETRISPAILDTASDDLKKIGLHLVFAVVIPNATASERAQEPALARAWSYKPAPPHQRGPQNRDPHQSPR